MPSQPLRATPGGGGWIKDSSGMMAPVGTSTSVKELMQLPKEMRDLAIGANTLIRGNLSPALWPDLAMLLSIAPRHRPTLTFVASVVAGSKAQHGQATTDLLQGIVNMLVPSALSPYRGEPLNRKKDAQRFSKNHDSKVTEEDE